MWSWKEDMLMVWFGCILDRVWRIKVTNVMRNWKCGSQLVCVPDTGVHVPGHLLPYSSQHTTHMISYMKCIYLYVYVYAYHISGDENGDGEEEVGWGCVGAHRPGLGFQWVVSWSEKKIWWIIILVGCADGGMMVEGRLCESQSHGFKGLCFSDSNCSLICHREGFTAGKCRGFRRRCFCTRHCWSYHPMYSTR